MPPVVSPATHGVPRHLLRGLTQQQAAICPHRLAAQDVALSRRKHRFDSGWGRHYQPGISLVRQYITRSPAIPASEIRIPTLTDAGW